MAKRIVDEEMRFTIIVNGDQGQKELYDLEKSTRQYTQRNKELRQEQAKLISQGKKQSEAYRRLDQEIKHNSSVIKTNKARMQELQKQIGVTGLTMAQLKKRASELRLQLHNMVPGSGQYKRFNNELKQVNVQIGKLRNQSRASQFSLGGLANSFNKYAVLGGSVIATVTGVVFSLQKLIDFNGKLSDSMSDVQKTTGMTREEVQALAKDFGLLKTRTDRINLLKIAEEGGRIGIAKEEIADFVAIMDKAVVALGDSFPGGAEETASKLGKLKLLFKETKDQKVDKAYNAIGSAINDLGAEGVASEINIANFATRVGSLPDALKPTIADALALGAAFEENGIQAEIAGRAYSILLQQAAKESEKFAQVMGLTNVEVQKLINDDPLEFLIKFAKGLKGMNATDTAKTLQFLGVSADGANKVLGALSNNTDRFIELMNLSNRSMSQGTSLINEYNIKNNNLQAILDKINKRIKGLIATPFSGLLESWARGFAKLLGISEDISESFHTQHQATLDSIKSNRAAAASAQKLLDEYKSLVNDGLEPTTEKKERLEEITLLLRDRFGESVTEIDRETGALILNTEAVKEQIKLKRLAASEEAANFAQQLVGVKEEIARQEQLLKTAQNIANTRKRIADKEEGKKDFLGRTGGSPISQKDAYAIGAQIKAGEIVNKINELKRMRDDINKKLAAAFFTEADADLFIKGSDVKPKNFNSGTGGNFNTPTGDGKSRRKSLLDFQRETEDLRLALIADSFRKELEIQRVAHQRKIQDLQSEKVTGVANATKINAEINKQIELQEQTHQLKLAAIYEKGITDSYKKEAEKYAAETQRRQTAHNNELAALGNNERAKEALREKFQKEELIREQEHLTEILATLEELKEAGNFGGLDLSILTPEQVAAFGALADQVKAKLAEIGVKKSDLQNSPDAGDQQAADALAQAVGSTDILGFTIDQWQQTFDSLDTTAEKLQAVGVAVNAMMNAWSMYAEFQRKNNAVELRNFEQLQDNKRRKLDKNLQDGYINQRQYEDAVRLMELETARKRAEIEYKQAKSEKAQALASVAINTALGIMQAYAQLGPIGGTIAAVFIGAMGALQTGLIAGQELPAKGFEQGYYGTMPVRREQDGRVYNASYGGTPTTQMVDRPTYFLAGEGGKHFPEMIIDGRAFRDFNPDFKESLYREIARVKGFEGGYYQNSTKAPSFESETSTEERQAMMQLILSTNGLLQDLLDNGIEAFLKNDLRTAKQIRESIKDYERLRNKNKR